MPYGETEDMLVKLGMERLAAAVLICQAHNHGNAWVNKLNLTFTVYHGMRGDTEHFYTIGIE